MKETEFDEYLDLSYSGISGLLQGDKEKGKEFLIRICNDYIKTAKLCEEKQHELLILKQDLSETRAGIDRTLTHLKMDKPLALIIEKSLIVISDKDVTVEKNVL